MNFIKCRKCPRKPKKKLDKKHKKLKKNIKKRLANFEFKKKKKKKKNSNWWDSPLRHGFATKLALDSRGLQPERFKAAIAAFEIV